MFNELVDQRLEKITNVDKKVSSNDLIHRYQGSTADTKFHQFDNAFSLFDEIRGDKIGLTVVKNDQAESKSNVNEIKKGNKKHRSNEQKDALYNIDMLYKAKNSVIEFFEDYSSVVSEA